MENTRFKFRVWDKEQNKYLPLVSRGDLLDFWISLDNTGIYLVERDNNRDVAYFNDITQDVVIQQCTGLKDKNGTLIYEGDILKIESGKLKMENNYGCVKWCDTIASFGILNNNSHYDFKTFDCEYIEVIGNIYKNKDLLESEE